MRCFRPVRVFSRPGGGISFSPRTGYTDRQLQIACGRCIGCRLEGARQWAVRAVHEASLHDENCFLTLTYQAAPLSLVRTDLQGFWKRLRQHLVRRAAPRILYLGSGEYGEETGRPHYHALVFGYYPPDAVRYRGGEYPLYKSAELEKLWRHGYVLAGSVTFESACYVAGYVTKKVTGPEAPGWYQAIDRDTGELVPIEPEFLVASRRPAVGRGWIEAYGHSDAWRHDSVVVRGSNSKVPRYYDKLLQRVSTGAERLQRKRERIARGQHQASQVQFHSGAACGRRGGGLFETESQGTQTMKAMLFAVHDVKVDGFMPPFAASTPGEAERNFRQACCDAESVLSKFPQDFNLVPGGFLEQHGGPGGSHRSACVRGVREGRAGGGAPCLT